MGDIGQIQKRLDAIITANENAVATMTELAVIAEKMTDLLINCMLCRNHTATWWICTTCPYEHVLTIRVCGECYGTNGAYIMNRCKQCGEDTYDWAVRGDNSDQWLKSWIENA